MSALPRILCLHGFAQNGSLFAKKSSGLRKALKKKGFDTYYLDAPVTVTPADLPFELSEPPQEEMLGWWLPRSDQNYSIEPALESVKTAIKEQGPFVGIVAFSQGSGLAAVVSKIWHQLAPEADPLKFVVLFSGFKLENPQYAHYYDQKIAVPSLHVFGSLDSVVVSERSEALLENFENGTKLIHPGGHFVPNNKPIVEPIVAFIQAQVHPEPEVAA